MKHLLLTTIAAVVLVGCGSSVDIWTASKEGNIAAVKQYLSDGSDVNAKDDVGWTPLHSAVREGHKEITKLLITNGADVNAKDRIVGTPLDSAMIYNHTKTADLLRKHGGKTGEELKAEGK